MTIEREGVRVVSAADSDVFVGLVLRGLLRAAW